MTKEEFAAMLKEHLTVEISSSGGTTQDGEGVIDTEIYIYFDGVLVAEARS